MAAALRTGSAYADATRQARAVVAGLLVAVLTVAAVLVAGYLGVG